MASPREIRLLDPHTVNQIAAGEVVERPASAVKELLENALDAGADQVSIELEGAGRRLIKISDNGCGMTPEQLPVALQRHATSKITRVEDLQSVASLGFRGEALPSIASVSVMTASTGVADGLRTKIRVEGGKVGEPEGVSGPRGTEFQVEDLFFNTPARLKFLKKDPTELSACVEIVSKYACARPDARISLRHEGRQLIQTSGSGDVRTAVAEVWGRETAKMMVPFDQYHGDVRVHGLVSPPHATRPTRNMQWLFVNGRPIKSRTVTAALDQACRAITPERRYPMAIVIIESDPARIDVNVSPTKSEVKFHAEGAIFDAVRRAVREALLETGMVPSAEDLAKAAEALRLASSNPLPAGGVVVPQPQLDMPRMEAMPEQMQPEAVATALPDLLEGLKIMGQVDQTFIVAENDNAILLIDQHVAHERVLYEMLRDTRGSGLIEVQKLLEPETIHVDRRAAELIAPRLEELKEVGFELEPFGGESFLVRSVPALVRLKHPMDILRDILDQMADGQAEGCVVPARDEVYILCSCKMAVKAGDPLGMPEMERLMQDLAKTENPYFCPHGRPITITISKGDLRRKFKR
jgi:DNA mismatch repair protein MutL